MSPIRPLAFASLALFPLILISSCATIFNGPAQKIRISTGKSISDLRVEKSIPIDSTVLGTDKITSYIVPRSSKPLTIHYRIDTTEKILSLRPHSSLAFWINIWFNYGTGMLVDWNNPKRYSYPAWTYLKASDTSISRHRFPSVHKHILRLSLGYPPVNIFNIASPEGPYNAVGIFGLETGLDYFYKNNRYLSMSVGAGTSYAPVDHIGYADFRTAGALYANIRNNYVIGSFDLGYGFNISKFKWVHTTAGNPVYLYAVTNTTALGLTLSPQYRIGNFFRIGALFQPNFINTSHSPTFNYQHYIAVQLCWKIPLH